MEQPQPTGTNGFEETWYDVFGKQLYTCIITKIKDGCTSVDMQSLLNFRLRLRLMPQDYDENEMKMHFSI